MAQIVGAFRGGDEAEHADQEVADLVEGARARRPQDRFEFREDEFNRIEIRTVRRQKPERGARLLDGGPRGGMFVHGQVIEHDDVVGAQCGDEDLLDVGDEGRLIDRSVEHGRRREPVAPERGENRVGLPVAEGRVIDESLAAETAAVPPEQIRRHATFVEKHQARRIQAGRGRAPVPTGDHNIGAGLFSGVYGFF